MIDKEDEIYDSVYRDIIAQYSDCYVTSTYVNKPPKFPCVSIVQATNQVFRYTQDTTHDEVQALLLFDVNVYSSKVDTAKSEAKAIMNVVDDGFAKLGFVRMMLEPIPNERDASIYRLVSRYRGIIDKNGVVYRYYRR